MSRSRSRKIFGLALVRWPLKANRLSTWQTHFSNGKEKDDDQNAGGRPTSVIDSQADIKL